MSKTPTVLLLLLLLLGLGADPIAWAVPTGKVPPVLDQAVMAGLHLHQSTDMTLSIEQVQVWQQTERDIRAFLKATTSVVLHDEAWLNITKEEWGRFDRPPTAPYLSYQFTILSFGSAQDAQAFASRCVTVDHDTLHWLEGTPSGQKIGAFCRYMTETPGPGATPAERQQAEERNRSILSLVFTRGRAIVQFDVVAGGGVTLSMTQAEHIARVLASRLPLRPGEDDDGPQFQAQVVSKHVKPHKNERAEIRLTSSTSPMSYSIQVKRQGQVVYQTQVSGQTGAYLFVWNGYTNSGQQASNGDHDVLITATDSFGRTATQTVQVVVNFQGK